MPLTEPLGRLEQAGDGLWRLVFTRHLPHPPEKVWRAVTEPEHLAAWFPTTVEGDREVGAKLRFTFSHEGAPALDGEMLAWDPPRRMELRWGDDDVLRIEVAADGDGTVLTLVDEFPDQGKAARDGAGWHARLDFLAEHLAGQPTSPEDGKRWADLAPVYRDALGPEASTIGPPDWHPEG